MAVNNLVVQKNSPSIERMQKLNLRAAILHSGGPAPGGNRVLIGAAKQFIDLEIPVIGFFDGYEHLQQLSVEEICERNLYIEVDKKHLYNAVDANSFILRTSRANPGKLILSPEDLHDPKKTGALRHILDIFESLRIGMLISIGGDDTLKTANYLYQLAQQRVEDNSEILFHGDIIHVPKTIDNDYFGIPWTFGYFTAAESAGRVVRNLFDDARATNTYHIVELMGRKAGWFTAAASIFADGTKAIIPEDFEEYSSLDIQMIIDNLLEIVIKRESEGKGFGVFCIAEGIADKICREHTESLERDKHGHITLRKIKIAERLAEELKNQYSLRTGRIKEFKPNIVGYETRQITPTLYDVLLTSQLGVGAFRLFEQGRKGEMVTVRDNLEIGGIPFSELVDPLTLIVKNRNININGDFYKLLRSLEDCHLKNRNY